MTGSLGLEPQLPGATASTGAIDQAPPPTPDQIRRLAAEFESLLLGQMLKEMRSSMLGESEGDSSGFGGNPLAEAVFSELSLALSRAGGIGIADSMMEPLSRQNGLDAYASAARALDASPIALTSAEAQLLSLPSAGAGMSLTDRFGGRVSSEFGWRQDPIDGSSKFHAGADIALPTGHPVPSARAGRVTFAGEQAGYGQTVVVEHEGGVSTRYAHLSEIQVKVGDEVTAGQQIARSGASGRVTGPHLHFEVLDARKPVDPEAFLQVSPAAAESWPR